MAYRWLITMRHALQHCTASSLGDGAGERGGGEWGWMGGPMGTGLRLFVWRRPV